jgi:hypothetical protein
MTEETTTNRARDLGLARIRLAGELTSPEDWKERWPEPRNPYPFALSGWRQCLCYTVDDYAAEAGFLIDVLGLPAPLFGPDNALLTSPDREFSFQICGTGEDELPTPPDTIALMFYLDNIREACNALAARGVAFHEPLAPVGGEGSAFHSAEFRTPHGVSVTLWGNVPAD